MIALIDGDLLVHQYTSPKDVDKATSGGQGTYRFPWDTTIKALGHAIERLTEAVYADSCVVTFSHKQNFRKEFFPGYKAHRTNRKPIMMADAIEWVTNKFNVKCRPGLEADDVMGIMATRAPGEYIICSVDKDMKTIPGLHYNWKDDFAEIEEVGDEEAERFWWHQTVVGDRSDGYPGAAGIGEVGARKALADVPREQLWDAVLACFGGDVDAALLNARCARILTAEYWDFERGKPILWSPPASVCGEEGVEHE